MLRVQVRPRATGRACAERARRSRGVGPHQSGWARPAGPREAYPSGSAIASHSAVGSAARGAASTTAAPAAGAASTAARNAARTSVVDVGEAEVLRHRDPQPGPRRVGHGGAGSRRRGPGREPARVRRRAGHDRQRQRQIAADAAIGPVTESVGQPRKPGILGTRPKRGLEPEHAAERRRDADRPAAVGAHRQRHQAGGDRGRRARRWIRPRVRVGITRVAGQPEQLVVGDAAVAELGVVGLADDDRAGRRRSRATRRSSCSGTKSASAREPLVAGSPASQTWSLTDDRDAGQRAGAAARRRPRRPAPRAARP